MACDADGLEECPGDPPATGNGCLEGPPWKNLPCLHGQCLQDAQLYVNPDKTHLFCLEIDFLGHHISSCGIEADNKKANWIMDWPVPKSMTETQSFLGLVRYPPCTYHSPMVSIWSPYGIVYKL